MKARSLSAGDLFHAALLRAASLLVPAAERSEWRREWRGELWHVREACKPSMAGWPRREVTDFCLGAFQDALCLRRADTASAASQGSPSQCLFVLVALLAASYGIALLLPGVRAERMLEPHHFSPNLVEIRLAAADIDATPTLSARLFRSWQHNGQRFFDGVAFYRTEQLPMQAALDPAKPANLRLHRVWQVADATTNLFQLLGLPIQMAGSDPALSDLPSVLLSERAWKRDFGAAPHVAGVVLNLGSRTVRIAGVAPDGSPGLPGNVDAWELDPNAAESSAGPGFVLARLTSGGSSLMSSPIVRISSYNHEVESEDLLGIALEQNQPATLTVFLFAVLLALLALPAITTVSLGEAGTHPHRVSWVHRLRRWSFFAAKAALLLPVLYLTSMDLAYCFTTVSHEYSLYIQLASVFGMSLFSMRWALKDQRRRCPVCMRLVTHPAQVGQASRTFLDWNGTEMMCLGGHTLLHVPSQPTSWFGAQRWLYLDTSWNFLFACSTRPIP